MQELLIDKNLLKDLLKNIANFNKSLERVDFKFEEEDSTIYAIDGGNNLLKDPVLEFLGANFVRVGFYSDGFFEKRDFVIFDNLPLELKKRQIENIKELQVFGESDEIMEKLNEKEYHFEKYNEEESFSLKIRNLMEIYFLIKLSEKEGVVLRDGSFYLPDLSNFKKLVNKKLKNRENIGSVAKSSKVLRNKLLIKNVKEGVYKINSLISELYEENNFLFNFDIYLVSFRKKSYYQLESENLSLINKIYKDVKRGKNGYPRSLIMVDKLVKAKESLVKKKERAILRELYEDNEIKEILSLIKEDIFQIRKF